MNKEEKSSEDLARERVYAGGPEPVDALRSRISFDAWSALIVILASEPGRHGKIVGFDSNYRDGAYELEHAGWIALEATPSRVELRVTVDWVALDHALRPAMARTSPSSRPMRAAKHVA